MITITTIVQKKIIIGLYLLIIILHTIKIQRLLQQITITKNTVITIGTDLYIYRGTELPKISILISTSVYFHKNGGGLFLKCLVCKFYKRNYYIRFIMKKKKKYYTYSKDFCFQIENYTVQLYVEMFALFSFTCSFVRILAA